MSNKGVSIFTTAPTTVMGAIHRGATCIIWWMQWAYYSLLERALLWEISVVRERCESLSVEAAPWSVAEHKAELNRLLDDLDHVQMKLTDLCK